MRFKGGVSIRGLKPEALLGLVLSEQAFRDSGAALVVTSVTDGKHREGSLHYEGLAFDLRTKHLPYEVREKVYRGLCDTLEPLGFDVLLEDDGEPNEHLHIEHDPKSIPRPEAV